MINFLYDSFPPDIVFRYFLLMKVTKKKTRILCLRLHFWVIILFKKYTQQERKSGGEMELKEASEVEAEKFKTNKTNITQTWVNKHSSIYKKATRHPFILSIRDGTIDSSSFKKWLGQDYIYVRAFVPFVASVLVKACEESDDSSDMDIILGGMASLNDEIAWFKEEASRWEVSLTSVVPQRANLMYCSFLKSLLRSEIEYTVAITAFWAVEIVYQESFAHCLQVGSKIPEELKETCQRWGNSGFGQYCHSLQNIADRCLEKASIDIIAKAEGVFLTVLEHEVEFWNMSKGEI